MKAAPFEYHAPKTTAEVVRLISGANNYRLLAGGQSLVPMLNLRLLSPDLLIDLNGVEELAGIEDKGSVLRIGAMTRQREIEKSELVRRSCPLLTDAIHYIGHQQTRNRGTIGGSLCHMDPGAELPVAAAALEATMVLTSGKGERTVRFLDFPAGILETNIRPGELLTHIEVPKLGAETGTAFGEFNRRPADFAIVSAACCLTLKPDGAAVQQLSIALGGVSPVPVRLKEFERMASGRRFGPELIAMIRDAASSQPAEDVGEYPGAFRSRVAGVIAARALERAHDRITGKQSNG
jgi:aerobic carbon-monoxide dehydrogenase medium subunit